MKTRNLTFAIGCFLGLAFMISSCATDTGEVVRKSYTDEEFAVISASLDLPQEVEEYVNIDLPSHMASSGFSIAGGTINNHGATLGRVLFHEKRLSKNNSISCASCHDQTKGFADPKALSEGFDGVETRRNSLALGNIRFYYNDRGFMWDERAESVEDQTRMTVTDHIEMGMDDWDEVVSKVSGDEYYNILFRKAFGDEEITEDRTQQALSMFVRSIISKGSKFDEAMAQDNAWGIQEELSLYTDQENRGRALYSQNCQSCHGNVVFLGRATANNGLDMEYEDNGIGELTNNVSDNGVFKVPHVRNIAVSGPYMHDGRFETLEEVLEHYSSGIQDHPYLAFDLPAGGYNFSATEKEDIIAFLNTLTDEEMAAAPRFKTPFK